MDKARKKELLKDYKAKEKQNFQDSLPLSLIHISEPTRP